MIKGGSSPSDSLTESVQPMQSPVHYDEKPQHILPFCWGFEPPTLGLTIQHPNHWTRAHLVEQENNENATSDVPTTKTIRDHDTEKQTQNRTTTNKINPAITDEEAAHAKGI